MHVGGGAPCVGGGRGWCGDEGKGTHRRRRQAFEVSCGHRARGHTIEQEGSRQPPVSKNVSSVILFVIIIIIRLSDLLPFPPAPTTKRKAKAIAPFILYIARPFIVFSLVCFWVFQLLTTHTTHTQSHSSCCPALFYLNFLFTPSSISVYSGHIKLSLVEILVMGLTPLARLHRYCCWSLRRKVPDQSLPSISMSVLGCGGGGGGGGRDRFEKECW